MEIGISIHSQPLGFQATLSGERFAWLNPGNPLSCNVATTPISAFLLYTAIIFGNVTSSKRLTLPSGTERRLMKWRISPYYTEAKSQEFASQNGVKSVIIGHGKQRFPVRSSSMAISAFFYIMR